jgi:hypothetical protein
MLTLGRFAPSTSPRARGEVKKARSFSRRTSAPELCSPPRRHSTIDSPPAYKGRRSAERRMPTTVRAAQTSLPTAQLIGRTDARQFGARPPSGASPRLLPKRASALAQPRPRFAPTSGCGRYPHHQWRLSEAPRAPVVMPAGSMPGPPECGVHGSARRHRTSLRLFGMPAGQVPFE